MITAPYMSSQIDLSGSPLNRRLNNRPRYKVGKITHINNREVLLYRTAELWLLNSTSFDTTDERSPAHKYLSMYGQLTKLIGSRVL